MNRRQPTPLKQPSITKHLADQLRSQATSATHSAHAQLGRPEPKPHRTMRETVRRAIQRSV